MYGVRERDQCLPLLVPFDFSTVDERWSHEGGICKVHLPMSLHVSMVQSR